MAFLPSFSTPANQQDFPDDPAMQQELNELWNSYVEAFVLQGMAGSYFNPLTTDISGAAQVPVTWFAFPGRVTQYLAPSQFPPNPYKYDQEALNRFADTGTVAKGQDYPWIPQNQYLCPQVDWSVSRQQQWQYGPWGPRGWQDEYCEWSVTRDTNGSIIRVDFTCENPEYWYSLWRVSPDTAAAVYEATLNHNLPSGATPIIVKVDDLTLTDANGDPVIDPSTGQPAYNPLNKWNTGTRSVRTGDDLSGGAMHLTSTPNTLQTETGLAGAATVQRTVGNTNPQTLICCSQYGQEYRNSDPHIGASVNGLVVQNALPYIVSLANPVGLYIQTPDFSSYGPASLLQKVPGSSFADCWQVVRGFTGEPGQGDHILHAVFQLPESWVQAGISMQDIEIAQQPIHWGCQIAATVPMGIYAWAIQQGPQPPVLACVGTPPAVPTPIQLLYSALWDAYYGTTVPNPMGAPMNLASNTVIIPVIVPQGAQGVDLALTCSGVAPGVGVAFPPPGGGPADITVSATTGPATATYAPPGNSFPSQNQLITFSIDVAPAAEPGLRELVLANPGDPSGTAGPAYLLVVEPGQFGTQAGAQFGTDAA